MAKIETAPPRGTRDLLPSDVSLRASMTDLILKVYLKHGFTRIETPCIENLDRLIGSDGGENEKLVFKILKRGDKLQAAGDKESSLADLGLRFDLTVPLARYYANNFSKLPAVFRAIQIGPVWRAERPQKGRYRQFVQCDIDIVGEPSVVAELELISTTLDAVAVLGITDLTLKYNDRRLLDAILLRAGVDPAVSSSVLVVLDKVEKLGLQQVEGELLELVKDQEVVKLLVGILENLSDNGQLNLEAFRDLGLGTGIIDDLIAIESLGKICKNTEFRFDPTVIRGMGYYTGPIFELSVPSLGFSIGGGGRYDNMMSRFGRENSACGFSLGFERLVIYLEEHGMLPKDRTPVVRFRCKSSSDFAQAKRLSESMAAHGVLCLTEGSTRKFDGVVKGLRTAFNAKMGDQPLWEVLIEVDGETSKTVLIGGDPPDFLAV